MQQLLPDRLQELWQSVDAHRLTFEEFEREKDRLVHEHKETWRHALLLDGYNDLKENLLAEIGRYVGCDDIAEVERRCQRAVGSVKAEWEKTVTPGQPQSIERFYDRSDAYIYDLMWWQALEDDLTPLAYVVALHFAQQRGCRTHLDFGAGVGSGSLLFAHHGFETTLADISSTLLDFSRWRLDLRGISAPVVDLKTERIPRRAFDIITAMDVFEHLVDPVGVVEQLADALKPGGFLFGRFHADPDAQRPQHIVMDFEPTFARLRELGFVEVWEDTWLWGHQAFAARSGPVMHPREP